MTVIFTAIGPRLETPLPGGYATPILAFEFAETEDDVVRILNSSAAEPTTVADAFDTVNRLDFLYIACYGLLLISFAVVAHRLTGSKWALVAAALAVLVIIADVLENVQLLAITRETGVKSIEDNLSRLHLWTWLKWGGLAVCMALLVPALWRGFGAHVRSSRITAAAAALPAALLIPAYVLGGPVTEIFALSIGLVFIFLTVLSWRRLPPAAGVAAPGTARPA